MMITDDQHHRLPDPARARAPRPDRRGDRRQRGHRAGNRPPSPASLLGDGLDARREQLRATLPIGRVGAQAEVAPLAVHVMTNTAPTGATYDVDGGQPLIA